MRRIAKILVFLPALTVGGCVEAEDVDGLELDEREFDLDEDLDLIDEAEDEEGDELDDPEDADALTDPPRPTHRPPVDSADDLRNRLPHGDPPPPLDKLTIEDGSPAADRDVNGADELLQRLPPGDPLPPLDVLTAERED